MTWQADVLTFWFDELKPADWFRSDPALDDTIRERFAAVLQRVSSSIPTVDTADDALATVLVLDQFSRNLNRGTAAAFANDDAALDITKSAIERGLDADLPPQRQTFLYMPFMHSESLADQDVSIRLFAGTASEAFAVDHRDIIARFGRYPYRNEAMGRETTPEERAYLKDAARFGQ